MGIRPGNNHPLFYHHNDLSPEFDKNRSVGINSLFLFSALQHPNFNPKWISSVISTNLFANELNFNHLKLYSGALHLCPLLQTFIYKYCGAPHLIPSLQLLK
jgi:hypothetical protein